MNHRRSETGRTLPVTSVSTKVPSDQGGKRSETVATQLPYSSTVRLPSAAAPERDGAWELNSKRNAIEGRLGRDSLYSTHPVRRWTDAAAAAAAASSFALFQRSSGVKAGRLGKTLAYRGSDTQFPPGARCAGRLRPRSLESLASPARRDRHETRGCLGAASATVADRSKSPSPNPPGGTLVSAAVTVVSRCARGRRER